MKRLILLTLLFSMYGVANASLLDEAKADKALYSQIQHSTELMELFTHFSKTLKRQAILQTKLQVILKPILIYKLMPL